MAAYAERDARQLAAIQDLGAFQRFLKLTAARTGQLLNMQSLASDAGVSDKTAKNWLSILETCYLIHYVRPHFANFGKRLTKSPKLYMTDVGLAAALIGTSAALGGTGTGVRHRGGGAEPGGHSGGVGCDGGKGRGACATGETGTGVGCGLRARGRADC